MVVLRYWLGLTEAEAAAELNCSVGTVKSQASRALVRWKAYDSAGNVVASGTT